MKVIVVCLTYGNRPLDIILKNFENAGYPFNIAFVNMEGIANALNEGLALAEGYDAVAFLANDIEEPEDWLLKKMMALATYPDAGIVASSLDKIVKEINNEHIISNWVIRRQVIDKVGLFNESMFPYGPIDLDYCERTWVAGFKTYYVKDLQAKHIGNHAEGDEYGWNKQEFVKKYWQQYIQDIQGYKNGTKDIKL